MSIDVVAHINLRGQARQALEFYHSIFGGEISLVSYKDAGNVQHPSDAEHVMWGQVTSESGFRIMAYDVPVGTVWSQGENAFFVSVRGETANEIAAYWKGLSDGAQVMHPLGPAQWTKLYGMLRDQFGVIWILDVVAPYNPA
jgi:PhnB protein